MKDFSCVVISVALVCTSSASGQSHSGGANQSRVELTDPMGAGFDPDRLGAIGQFVEGKLAEGAIPGAVVIVGTRKGFIKAEAYGYRSIGEVPEPMTLDTVFELASVTKPIAGASAVLKAAELGLVSFGDSAADHVTAFRSQPVMSLRHLASHASGLPPVVDVESRGIFFDGIGPSQLRHNGASGWCFPGASRLCPSVDQANEW